MIDCEEVQPSTMIIRLQVRAVEMTWRFDSINSKHHNYSIISEAVFTCFLTRAPQAVRPQPGWRYTGNLSAGIVQVQCRYSAATARLAVRCTLPQPCGLPGDPAPCRPWRPQ